jgi:hypothetical protein
VCQTIVFTLFFASALCAVAFKLSQMLALAICFGLIVEFPLGEKADPAVGV